MLEQIYLQFDWLPPSLNSLYKPLNPSYDGVSRLRKFQIDLLEHLEPFRSDISKKIIGPVSIEFYFLHEWPSRDLDHYIKQ